MADGSQTRRRKDVPERIDYKRKLEKLSNFVDSEQRNELPFAVFLDPQPEWKKRRQKSIQTLKKLSEKLDTQVLNNGKTLGNKVVGQMFMNTGTQVHLTGISRDNASNVTEPHVFEKLNEEVKAILKKDEKSCRPLKEWLELSSELNAAVETILNSDLPKRERKGQRKKRE